MLFSIWKDWVWLTSWLSQEKQRLGSRHVQRPLMRHSSIKSLKCDHNVICIFSLNNSQCIPRRCASPALWPEPCWYSFVSQTFPLWRAAVLTDMRALGFLLVNLRPQITSLPCQHREVQSHWYCLPSLVVRFIGFYLCICATCAWFALWSAVRCHFEFSGVKYSVFCSWKCFP